MGYRDLQYEQSNIGYNKQYLDGGIKCKNYELCNKLIFDGPLPLKFLIEKYKIKPFLKWFSAPLLIFSNKLCNKIFLAKYFI